MPASATSQIPQRRDWEWRWTCVACGNYNVGGEYCARCSQHWAGKSPPKRGQSARRKSGGGGGGGNSASSAHPSSWRSPADPTGGAAPNRRSKSQEPKAKSENGDSKETAEDRQAWVKKEINSQIEKGYHHVRILTPEEAVLHSQFAVPPYHRKDKAARDEYTRIQRNKLQQALANFRTQVELGNDLSEAESLVGLHRRTVFAALPIPEQLTQYERVCVTTEAKMEYCKVGTHAQFAPICGGTRCFSSIAHIISCIGHLPLPICALPDNPHAIPISTFWFS